VIPPPSELDQRAAAELVGDEVDEEEPGEDEVPHEEITSTARAGRPAQEGVTRTALPGRETQNVYRGASKNVSATKLAKKNADISENRINIK
jgi:hypothetical protein